MSLDKLKSQLSKLGYTKQAMKTKTIILVYVPKAEREYHLDLIAKKIGGMRDKSPKILRAVSGSGAVITKDGQYYIGVKPDMSKGLSTDEQETLQGIFIATRMAKPNTDYSLNDLRQYGDKYTDSKFKIDRLYEKAGKPWIEASIITSNKVATYASGIYRVQQRSGSQFEKNISDAAKKLIKKSGHNMRLDKWNPADVWLVRPNMLKTDFSKFKSILELNEFLLKTHKEKSIIGVSLKMVKKTAKLEVFNSGIRQPYNFRPPGKFDLGKNFVNSLAGTLHYNGGKIDIRNFGRPENVSAEIQGKFAQGGKAGTGAFFGMIKELDPKFKTQDQRDILRMYATRPDTVIKHLYTQMKQLQPLDISYEEFSKAIKGKKNVSQYVISKYQVCDIMQSIKRMSPQKREDLIDSILSYAASATKISSIFIKVS